MTAPDTAGIEAALAAGLAAHGHGGRINSKERWTLCLCDERIPWQPHEDVDEHDDSLRAHVAAALLPVVTQAQAGALREAADVADRGTITGLETTRPDLVARWLRARADIEADR